MVKCLYCFASYVDVWMYAYVQSRALADVITEVSKVAVCLCAFVWLFYVMVIIHFVRWCCTLVTVNSNMALNVKCTHSTRWLEHCIQTNSVLCWKSFGTTHHTAVTKTKKKVYFFCRAYRREKKEHTELANRAQ